MPAACRAAALQQCYCGRAAARPAARDPAASTATPHGHAHGVAVLAAPRARDHAKGRPRRVPGMPCGGPWLASVLGTAPAARAGLARTAVQASGLCCWRAGCRCSGLPEASGQHQLQYRHGHGRAGAEPRYCCWRGPRLLAPRQARPTACRGLPVADASWRAGPAVGGGGVRPPGRTARPPRWLVQPAGGRGRHGLAPARARSRGPRLRPRHPVGRRVGPPSVPGLAPGPGGQPGHLVPAPGPVPRLGPRGGRQLA